MFYSKYFIHTLYEVPKEGEIPSHILLLRASYIYPTASGIFSLLPLGHRVSEKIKDIMREEMDGIDGIEIDMPTLNPAELWRMTGRYYDIGQELFRIKDRRGREFVLAMTHEEVVTDIAKQFIHSYRDLPVMLYQIHTKIRDEARPRGGLIRLREFMMKDAYSFHSDFDDMDLYYPKMYNAYLRIFARCGLKSIPIEADTGIMGGKGSHEFMSECSVGEDRFVTCTNCDYRANTEKAVGIKIPLQDLPENSPGMEKVSTPDVKTIADLMDFFRIAENHFLKTVAYEANSELVLALIQGNFTISETKLANYLKTAHLDFASDDLISNKGLYAGFISPVGVKGIRMVMDTSVSDKTLYITGANEVDMHFKNVLYGRDFSVSEIADIAEARQGDKCAQCQKGVLEIHKGIELGHTFKLGTKYTDVNSMNVTYLNINGEQKPIPMGCYGIGVERLIAAVIEQWHDNEGIIWPVTVAPFQVILTPLGKSPEIQNAAENLYSKLCNHFEVLYDDRDESAGVKLKDADLLGIPIRVIISQRLLKKREAEIKVRQTGEVRFCLQDDLETTIKQLLQNLSPSLDGLNYMK